MGVFFHTSDRQRQIQAGENFSGFLPHLPSLFFVPLLKFRTKRYGELNEVIEQLQDLILTLDIPPTPKSSDAVLSNSFWDAVKQSAKSGVKI